MKITTFEVEGVKKRGRLKKTWKKEVDKDLLELELKLGLWIKGRTTNLLLLLLLATSEERLKIYDDVAGQFPKAYAPKRLPLEFLSG